MSRAAVQRSREGVPRNFVRLNSDAESADDSPHAKLTQVARESVPDGRTVELLSNATTKPKETKRHAREIRVAQILT